MEADILDHCLAILGRSTIAKPDEQPVSRLEMMRIAGRLPQEKPRLHTFLLAQERFVSGEGGDRVGRRPSRARR